MKSKKYAIGLVGGVLLYALTVFSVPTQNSSIFVEQVQAQELGDDLSGSSSSSSSSSSSDESIADNGVADLYRGYQAMTKDQLEESTEKVSPITNIFGYIIGAVVAIIAGAIFVITAFDLAYIAIPPLRGILYKETPQVGGGAMMGGGYGRGMYGGGMMGGMQQQQPQSRGFQIISDEAVQCSMLLGNGQQVGMQGGMQGGMYGGGMMGGMQQQQQQMTTKSVIGVYFKKRVFFMIILAICMVMLTSSLFLNTGINLALWFTKLMEMINAAIPR